MSRELWKSQDGTVAVMVGLMLAMIMGFVGLALDVGNLMITKTRMQNAVDAAVCGGGLLLPDQTQATTVAKGLITNNNFDQAGATITFNQDVARNPGNAPEINCNLTNNVPTIFMAVFGFQSVSLTASAEGIVQQGNPKGPFSYTIFSGSPTDTLTLNGSQTVKGSVHSNDKLTVNGSSNISGAAEGANKVTVNGSGQIGTVSSDTVDHIRINGSVDVGNITGGAENIDMPDYTQQIESIAAQKYSGNQTLNGNVDVTGNMYVTGNVILNGSVNSTGTILSTGNITINGSSSISGSNQIFLYSANGNITVNGSNFNSSTSSVIIYAPNGTITLNGSVHSLQGRVIGNKVTINGSGNFNGDDYQVTSLPVAGHVKLIK